MPLSAKDKNKKTTPKKSVGADMKGALIASGFAHVVIFVLGMVALPHAIPEMIVDEPFPVEIVEVDLITQTNKAPKPKQAKPPEEPPKPETVDSEAPPDLLTPKPEKIEEPVPEPPKEELKPPEEKPKEKPEPPKEVTKKEPEKPKRDFQSLLKNLTPDESKDQEDIKDVAAEDTDDAPKIDRFSDRLTMSEQDALRAQLAQCWNVMAGAKYAEDLVVAIKVTMNPDRTVRSAAISEQIRYSTDSHYRAAADSALRALRNPRCTPLDLPEDKYEEWKTITIRFDPRQML